MSIEYYFLCKLFRIASLSNLVNCLLEVQIYPWFSVLLAACDFIVGKSGIQRLYSVWLQRGNWDDRNFEENKSFIRRFHYNLVSMTFLNVKEVKRMFPMIRAIVNCLFILKSFQTIAQKLFIEFVIYSKYSNVPSLVILGFRSKNIYICVCMRVCWMLDLFWIKSGKWLIFHLQISLVQW